MTLRRKVASIALAVLGIAGTSLPAAAQTDNFTPQIRTNPACVEADGFTARPGIPGYGGNGNSAYMLVVDDDGALTDSTFTHGSQWCVRADWHFPAYNPNGGTCHYMFYVPNDVNAFFDTGGGADASFVVGFYGSDGRILAHSDPVPEAALSGFTPLRISGDENLSATFTGINIGSNNGQAPGAAQIGFGVDAVHSLRRECP
jgi:hypothetical protein